MRSSENCLALSECDINVSCSTVLTLLILVVAGRMLPLISFDSLVVHIGILGLVSQVYGKPCLGSLMQLHCV